MTNLNDFIFIRPKRNRPTSAKARESIRTGFTKSKRGEGGFILTIYLGKNIAEKIEISKGEKVAVGYDKNNPRKLFLKKANTGYTVTELSSKNKDTPSFRIMLQWQQFVPNEIDMPSKIIKNHEFFEDGVIVNL
jgi:hypothetical protein